MSHCKGEGSATAHLDPYELSASAGAINGILNEGLNLSRTERIRGKGGVGKKDQSNISANQTRWGQIIIKLAEPETWFYAWRGRYWQSKALESAGKGGGEGGLHRNATVSTRIINIYVCLQDSIETQ